MQHRTACCEAARQTAKFDSLEPFGSKKQPFTSPTVEPTSSCWQNTKRCAARCIGTTSCPASGIAGARTQLCSHLCGEPSFAPLWAHESLCKRLRSWLCSSLRVLAAGSPAAQPPAEQAGQR